MTRQGISHSKTREGISQNWYSVETGIEKLRDIFSNNINFRPTTLNTDSKYSKQSVSIINLSTGGEQVALAVAMKIANKKIEMASSKSNALSRRKTLVSREDCPLKIYTDFYPEAVEI